MPDITLQNDAGVRIVVSEDGSVKLLGKSPTGNEPRAVSRPSDQAKPPPSDEELGLDSPLAKPTGSVVRPSEIARLQSPVAPAASVQAPPRADAGTGEPEAPLVKEDPIGNVIVGGGAAKAGAVLGRAVGGGFLGAAAEGATVAGAPVLAETGDPLEAAKAASLGAGAGTVIHALPAIPGAVKNRVNAVGEAAQARNAERLPTAITGGATSKAAKAVVGARDILRETAEAHPDLTAPILTGTDEAKHAAISGKLNGLTAANDADIDQIAARHPAALGGRVPTDKLYSGLADLAQSAHDEGDEKLIDAVKSTVDSVQRFEADTGTIAPKQLRKIRNDLAKKLAGDAAPGSATAQAARDNAIKVKGVLNGAIETLADETPGVDVAAHKLRNRQIASLLPAQNFLEQKAETAELQPQRGPIGRVVDLAGKIDVAHPLHNVTGPALAAADAAAPRLDMMLAKLAGNSGPAGVAALKQVALTPTRETLQAAIRTGVTPQIALQVARLGAAQPTGGVQ